MTQNLEQLYLEEKQMDAAQSTVKSILYVAGSIAATVAGALTDNETLSHFLIAGGLTTLPITALGLYADVKRYTGLERQIESLE